MALERGRKHIRRPGGGGSKRMVLINEDQKKPSELRYIWLALFGFYILLSETGVRQVMNGFVNPVMRSMNSTKFQTDTALITIPMSSTYISGPVCSIIYQRVGARISILFGAMMCFGGYIFGTFCNSIYPLMGCTLSIGIGCGLMRNSIISVQCEYFRKKRDMVMSFISIGPGVGIFILPRLQKYFMNKYDGAWEPCWYYLSFLYVICGLMALFITKTPSEQTESLSFTRTMKVFKIIEFDFHLCASFLASCVNFIYMSNILVLMETENIQDTETIYSYQGIANIVGKFLMTYIMSKDKIKIGYIIIVSYTIAQISLFSGAFCYSVWQFRVQNFFSGFGIGFYTASSVPFLVAIAGPSQLAYALGYTNFINGIAICTVSWFTDIVSSTDNGYDARSAFKFSICLGISAILIGSATSIILMMRQKHKRKPSMKQMRHSSELNALKNITAVENS